MGWNFWKRKRDQVVEQTMAQVQEHLTQISDRFNRLEKHLSDSSVSMAEMNEQVRKLSRLQYKMGQDSLSKLEGLSAGLTAVQNWQDKYALESARLDGYEQQVAYLEEVLLSWLDDFDLLAVRLQTTGQEMWQTLVEKWTSQTLQALQVLGLQEIKVLGTSFNPQIAECIGTVSRPSTPAGQENAAPDQGSEKENQTMQPYEVAEVVKRGFANEYGHLKRKAQVIVYEERDHE